MKFATHLAATVALALGALAAPTAAQAQASFSLQFGSPAPVYRTAPAARPGYVWVPGGYVHRGGHRYQNQGHWVRDQRRYRHEQRRWGRHDDRRGDYARPAYGPRGDLDRDGIANRYDRDRDGDGVRNRQDRSPNNPYRR